MAGFLLLAFCMYAMRYTEASVRRFLAFSLRNRPETQSAFFVHSYSFNLDKKGLEEFHEILCEVFLI